MSVTIGAYGGIPLAPGTIIPSGIGPFAAGAFTPEAVLTTPVQLANSFILQVDAYTRGVGFPSGAAFGFPFPVPTTTGQFPIGFI